MVSRRRGGISLWLVLFLPILVTAAALVINFHFLRVGKEELQGAADAAALAAGLALVDDRALLDDPALTGPLLAEAGWHAQRYAAINSVMGQPLELDPRSDSDLLFGRLDQPRGKLFAYPQGPRAATAAPMWFNAVRVTAQRSQRRGTAIPLFGAILSGTGSGSVAAAATAFLDRDVIGLGPRPGQPAPLVPIALLSDPTGNRPASWEFQVPRGGGGDHFRFDRHNLRFLEGSDGLAEMTVQMQVFGQEAPDDLHNAALLQIGVRDWAGLIAQLRHGLTLENLADYPRQQLVLGEDGRLRVPASVWLPPDPDRQAELAQMLQALQNRAEHRVWPLFIGLESDRSLAVLTGFVAARIVRVEVEPNVLRLVLQPCMMSTITAVTDVARRPGVGVNPYMCKVRLVE